MSRNSSIVGTLIAAGLVAAALPAYAQNPYRLKPGATGKNCLECHATLEETMKLASVHTPVRSGDCASCHSPHASAHGKLLAAGPDEICLECHDDVIPEVARSVHEMIAAGDCVACHDPHATPYENNLLRAGNDLCSECHSDLTTATAAVQFKHNPVEKGCISCHDPHASSESDFLLRSTVPELCVGCHDTKRPSFSQQHMGYPVGQARCTSCHDPHGSDSPGMLWASVHRPITNKMCNQCHVDPSAADPFETKARGADLCRGCHNSEVNAMLAKSQLHWPLADGVACQHCHSPHASKQAALMPGDPIQVCGACHQDTIDKQERSESKHVPVSDGECTMCHAPHSSDSAFLLAADNTIELCGTCHDWESHSTHPLGEGFLDMRNSNLTVDCSSCHHPHGSDHKHLAPYNPTSELCVDCHESFRR
jgi:DmsE family decaheme c-type cytochrome